MNRPAHIWSALRPRQWVKNLFVFLPLFFALRFTETEALLRVAASFGVFCLAGSAVYLFNDLRDRAQDRLHPRKRLRPIAAGLVAPGFAYGLSAFLAFGSLLAAYTLNRELLLVMAAYLLLNLAYSLGLKHFAIIDLVCISLGFLLRLLAGAVVVSIVLSKWIVLMTFLLALFLGLGKRRDDLLAWQRSGVQHRPALAGYSLPFIQVSMTIIVAVMVVAYLMYTISAEISRQLGSEWLFVTVLWVILGVLRYFQLVFVYERPSDPTELLLGDLFLQIIIGLWGLTFFVLIY